MRGLELVQADRAVACARVILALLVAVTAACAPLPERAPPRRGGGEPDTTPSYPVERVPPTRSYGNLDAYPRSATEVSGAAVLSLIEQARAEVAAGRPDQAVAALETALDIEPRNPFVWQQLAATHLAQHLPDQAENKAQRSSSFARGNPYVEVENWRVIAAARQARGDLAGARAARERVDELQDLLDD